MSVLVTPSVRMGRSPALVTTAVVITGRIVSDVSALATITTGGCRATRSTLRDGNMSAVISRVIAAHLSLQPGFGQPPVAHYCIGGHVED